MPAPRHAVEIIVAIVVIIFIGMVFRFALPRAGGDCPPTISIAGAIKLAGC